MITPTEQSNDYSVTQILITMEILLHGNYMKILFFIAITNLLEKWKFVSLLIEKVWICTVFVYIYDVFV